jgi:hypothetical protein
MTLTEMKNVDIRTVDPATLVDIESVVVKADLPVDERMLDVAEQLGGNPYIFKYIGKEKEIPVKIGFTNTTNTVNDCMESHLRTL